MAKTARGLTLPELIAAFPNDDAAKRWIENARWHGKPYCPYCGSENVKACRQRAMDYRCAEKDCRKRFNVKIGTAMEGSRIGYQKWAIAMYLMASSPKGVSSIKLHDDLGVTQKTAWFMGHRIRQAFKQRWGDTDGKGNGGGGRLAFTGVMAGPVEVDEAYFGGLEKNKHADKKLHAGRGFVGKTGVAGAVDRATNTVQARLIDNSTRPTLQKFVHETAAEGAMVYTDEASAYQGLPRHATVNHGRGHYVEGDCHVNSIESFWAMLKRAHKGVYHKMSPKHLQRYIDEFAGRHNIRDGGPVLERMALIVEGLVGKRLTYDALTAPNGRTSGARS